MPKKDMKSALSNSLKAEDLAVKDRFERAEAVLGDSLSSNESSKSVSQGDDSSQSVPKKKVIRDSFTLPQSDYELIETVRNRCLGLTVSVNKSEVIRAGLHTLNQMPDAELLAVIENLAKVKTGRPPKSE